MSRLSKKKFKLKSLIKGTYLEGLKKGLLVVETSSSLNMKISSSMSWEFQVKIIN